VGVDVEDLQRTADFEQISDRFFAPGERLALEALSGPARREAFFNAWTRKEAYLKARGTGLTRSLQDFDVSLIPGDPARLVRDARDPQAPERWSLRALDPGPDYAAALAVEGCRWTLSGWQF
jgi:4'-phosphopantetheinyl transferase